MLDFFSSETVHNACKGYCPAFLYDELRSKGLWDHLFQNDSGYLQQLTDIIYENPVISTTVIAGSLTAGAFLALKSIHSQTSTALLSKDLIQAVTLEPTLLLETSDDAQINTFRFATDATEIQKTYSAVEKLLKEMLDAYRQENDEQQEQCAQLSNPEVTLVEIKELYKSVFDRDMPDELTIQDATTQIEEALTAQLEDSTNGIQKFEKCLEFIQYKAQKIETPIFEIARCAETGRLLIDKSVMDSPSMAIFIMALLSKGQKTDYSRYYPMLFSDIYSEAFVDAVENAQNKADKDKISVVEQISRLILKKKPESGVEVADDKVFISEEYSYLFAKFLATNHVHAVGGEYNKDLNLKNLSKRDWYPQIFEAEAIINAERASQILALNKDKKSKILSKEQTGFSHDYIVNIDSEEQLDVICIGPIAGSGAFGEVHVGRSLIRDELLAIKILHNVDADAESEGKVLEALGEHRGTFKSEDDKLVMISKFYKGTDLFEFLLLGPDKAVELDLAIKACESIQFMHDRGYIHLDVKPENFMVDDTGDSINIFRIDFGTSLSIENVQEIREDYTKDIPKGTNGRMAPEVEGTHKYSDREQFKDRIYSTAADVYSLGIMLRDDLGIKNDTVNSMLEVDYEKRIQLPEVIKQLKLAQQASQKADQKKSIKLR
ncbi:protein kinase family protein [Candidatus Berkiella cookevillensis]|uniref:Protein kinase family protein n=1 Tax=Candidatus Berkiella cookevillensis TaxID=437022 RepID=A0A0Q9Y9U6_9GAMM|nr:protein kinase family protein [Candidatus Berkiella cookevillensis]MCS5707967.1 protein kinase family protein [Candidatus Berkiella cookevillensis]